MSTKTVLISGALAAGVFLAAAFAQPKRLSAPADTSVTIGGSAITVKYSAPSMRGRKIFGELVPFGKVWRFGANEATALSTDADLQMGGLAVPKGKYTLYVLPGTEHWQLIVSKQTGQWGTVYKPDMDLGRVEMKLAKSDGPVETMKITLSGTGDKDGQLKMEWETSVATVAFSIK